MARTYLKNCQKMMADTALAPLAADRRLGVVFFPAFDWAISETHPEREERLLYTRDQLLEEGLFDIPGITEYRPAFATHEGSQRLRPTVAVPGCDRQNIASVLVCLLRNSGVCPGSPGVFYWCLGVAACQALGIPLIYWSYESAGHCGKLSATPRRARP